MDYCEGYHLEVMAQKEEIMDVGLQKNFKIKLKVVADS